MKPQPLCAFSEVLVYSMSYDHQFHTSLRFNHDKYGD